MVWGAVSSQGVAPLKPIEGIMRKEHYHNILVRHGIPAGLDFIGKGFVYQEDNDPKHASKLCRDYLAKKEKKGLITLTIRFSFPCSNQGVLIFL